jgi:hypothetical protein
VDDEDSWDFGTVKQAPPPVKPSLSPSQYSMTNENKYQSPQLPRTASRNQINPIPSNSRINEVTVTYIDKY